MKQEIITIEAKNKKLGGFSRVVGEVEFSQMIDKDDYEITKGEISPARSLKKVDVVPYTVKATEKAPKAKSSKKSKKSKNN